jgi:hypothetical protein
MTGLSLSPSQKIETVAQSDDIMLCSLKMNALSFKICVYLTVHDSSRTFDSMAQTNFCSTGPLLPSPPKFCHVVHCHQEHPSSVYSETTHLLAPMIPTDHKCRRYAPDLHNVAARCVHVRAEQIGRRPFHPVQPR